MLRSWPGVFRIATAALDLVEAPLQIIQLALGHLCQVFTLEIEAAILETLTGRESCKLRKASELAL